MNNTMDMFTFMPSNILHVSKNKIRSCINSIRKSLTIICAWLLCYRCGLVRFGRGVVVIGQYPPPPPPNPPQWDMDSNARKAPIGGEHFSVCSHWSRDASPRVVGPGGGGFTAGFFVFVCFHWIEILKFWEWLQYLYIPQKSVGKKHA